MTEEGVKKGVFVQVLSPKNGVGYRIDISTFYRVWSSILQGSRQEHEFWLMVHQKYGYQSYPVTIDASVLLP